MQDNFSTKIKQTASILTTIEIICYILCGVAGLFLNPILGIIIITIGILSSLLLYFILLGFAQIIDFLKSIEENTHKILLKSNTNDKKELVNPKSTLSSINYNYLTKDSTSTVINPEPDNVPEKSKAIINDNNTVTCSNCNFTQPEGRKVCWHCGTKFIYESIDKKSNDKY